ncbi:hypothetical protein VTI74DRAFT_2563 [Chaetomium olivicolor]
MSRNAPHHVFRLRLQSAGWQRLPQHPNPTDPANNNQSSNTTTLANAANKTMAEENYRPNIITQWLHTRQGPKPAAHCKPLTEVGPRCPLCRELIFSDRRLAEFDRLDVPEQYWLEQWFLQQRREEDEDADQEMEDSNEESDDSKPPSPVVSMTLRRPAGAPLPNQWQNSNDADDSEMRDSGW